MSQDVQETLEEWLAAEKMKEESLASRLKPINFIEIANIPKKIDAVSTLLRAIRRPSSNYLPAVVPVS